jgi:2'-5' RNA ligase
MNEKKFLTVMAVFDLKTQQRLGEIRSFITERVGEGTQTMGIPFHITLGSYATDEIDAVIDRIKRVCDTAEHFEIRFFGQDSFGDKVLFLKPEKCDELLRLRSCFENDYANGYEWVPHATLFCGEDDQVRRARELVSKLDIPYNATVVGIELGEFFPPKKIIRIDF